MKPLIIGEAPGKNGDPTTPIEGRIGRRLAECAGIPFDEFLTTFDRRNLLDVQPQDSGKGADFNVRAAARVARELEKQFTPGQTVLILGKRAASAFRITDVAYFQPLTINGAKVYIMPHPSGVNTWWNLLENELQAIRFMHRIVKELK